jgi:hypothetical protein
MYTVSTLPSSSFGPFREVVVMDGSRFDAWTRRRVGLAAGGVTIVLLGLADADVRAKKKQKKKQRCRTLNQSCRRGGKRQRCCRGLACDEGKVVTGGLSCCRGFQAECDSENQCCGALKCQPAIALSGDRCCSLVGQPCRVAADCCVGVRVICKDGTCFNDV